MMIRILTIIFASILVTGCGTTPQERSVSGAGIGAGAGAIVGAVTGLSVLEGAALGAVGGALTGALTKEEDINLGKPAWKQGSSQDTTSTNQDHASTSQDHASTSQDRASPKVTANSTVAQVQHGLKKLGYNPGPVDGIYGPKTRQAIRQYQQDHDLLVDGQVTPALADHINSLITI